MNLDELIFEFNKVIVHPTLEEAISEVSKLGVSLPDFTTNVFHNPEEMIIPNGELVIPVGKIEKTKLNPSIGIDLLSKGFPIVAYDESINKFTSLEGIAYLTSHSLILLARESFIPVNYLTFYFYTKSEELVNKSKHIKLSIDPENDFKKDYMRDRINFLVKTVPENSILFIDGPLIGGDAYTIMMHSIKNFHTKNIIPIFFVKNSSSNLVTDNINELRKKYNSDMHWSYKYLQTNERTNFFIYQDKVNPANAKVFCYIKAFNISPQRVEFHKETFMKYVNLIDSIMDLVLYFIIAQGNLLNPQVRPIAIAELYARETIKLINLQKLLKEAGIVPTFNQTRFGD